MDMTVKISKEIWINPSINQEKNDRTTGIAKTKATTIRAKLRHFCRDN
jgi:hypothetical protein